MGGVPAKIPRRKMSNPSTPQTLNTLDCVSFNMQGGLANKIDQINLFLQESRPCILGLQETKIYQEDERHWKSKFPNYTAIFNSLSAKQAQRLRDQKELQKNPQYKFGTAKATRKRGVALLIRNDLHHHVVAAKSHFSFQGRIVWAKIQLTQDTLFIYNIYAPNCAKEQKEFHKKITKLLKTRKNKK